VNSVYINNSLNDTPRTGPAVRFDKHPGHYPHIPQTRSLSTESQFENVTIIPPHSQQTPVYLSKPAPILTRSRINEIENTLQNVHRQMQQVPENPSADNAQLIVSEVDKVLKILSHIEQKVSTTSAEKNSEAEIWKSKYENQLSLTNQLQANF